MSLSNSPSLDDYSDGIPPDKPPKNIILIFVRISLTSLILIVITLSVLNLRKNGPVAQVFPNGSITGTVFDTGGTPLAGEVFIIGSSEETLIQPDGSFKIEGVPAGEISLAVAHNGSAIEYNVNVAADEITDLGLLEFVITTPVP